MQHFIKRFLLISFCASNFVLPVDAIIAGVSVEFGRPEISQRRPEIRRVGGFGGAVAGVALTGVLLLGVSFIIADALAATNPETRLSSAQAIVERINQDLFAADDFLAMADIEVLCNGKFGSSYSLVLAHEYIKKLLDDLDSTYSLLRLARRDSSDVEHLWIIQACDKLEILVDALVTQLKRKLFLVESHREYSYHLQRYAYHQEIERQRAHERSLAEMNRRSREHECQVQLINAERQREHEAELKDKKYEYKILQKMLDLEENDKQRQHERSENRANRNLKEDALDVACFRDNVNVEVSI